MMLFIQEVFSLYIEFPHAEVKIEGMEHIEVPGMLHIRQRYDPTKIDDLAGASYPAVGSTTTAESVRKTHCGYGWQPRHPTYSVALSDGVRVS